VGPPPRSDLKKPKEEGPSPQEQENEALRAEHAADHAKIAASVAAVPHASRNVPTAAWTMNPATISEDCARIAALQAAKHVAGRDGPAEAAPTPQVEPSGRQKKDKAMTKKKKMKVKKESGSESGEASAKSGSNPKSLTDWIKQQDKIFGHLRKLPANWIRICSRSKGTVYFYNTESGESARSEPAAEEVHAQDTGGVVGSVDMPRRCLDAR